jgi:Cu/Ag efflux protein CusF
MPVALALALVLGVAGVAAAQAPTSGSTAAKKTDVQKPASRSVSGTVKSASLETVVVTGRDKGKDAEWTFAVEPTTNIRKGDKSIVAGDLKPGDVVQVRFAEQDGRAVARSILVKGKDAAARKTRS